MSMRTAAVMSLALLSCLPAGRYTLRLHLEKAEVFAVTLR